MPTARIQTLVDKFFADACTVAEKEELAAWVDRSANDDELHSVLEQAWQQHKPLVQMPRAMSDRILTALFQREEVADHPPAPPVPMIRRYRWVAAAVFFLLAGAGGWWWSHRPVTAPSGIREIAHDIKAPGTNRATLTLSNGQVVYVDSAEKGPLGFQGQVRIQKLADGRIAYQGAATQTFYNTLTNPRGSKVVDLTMSDGTRVWLNAGSSLRYPAAFTGTERKVSVEGEAYFEVAPRDSQPFIVEKGALHIQVLGTRFNVNAYDDEADIRVTLLEGKVNVRQGAAAQLLRPGQQARVSDRVQVSGDVDLDQVMAWKNDKFDFGESTDLQAIMRQVARWYDVEIEYRGPVRQSFGGSISRQVNVSKVLEKLALTERVKFQVQGKKIIVN